MNAILKAIDADYYDCYTNIVFEAMKNIATVRPANTYVHMIKRISTLMSVDPLLKSTPITPEEVMNDLLDQETREWFIKEACSRAGKFNNCSNRFYANLATIAFAMDDQMKLISSEEFGGLYKEAEAIIQITSNNDDKLYVIKDVINEIVIVRPETGMSTFRFERKLSFLLSAVKAFVINHRQEMVDVDTEDEEEEEIDIQGVYMPEIDELFVAKNKSAQLLFNEHEKYHERYYERKELLSALLKKSKNLFGLPIDHGENKYPNLSEFLRV